MSYKDSIKKVWNFLWNDNSIWSWIVSLLLAFILIKFIFFPILTLITGASLPLVIVESGSMYHQIASDSNGNLFLCSQSYSKAGVKSLNFNEYWNVCGPWYESKNITKQEFSNFKLSNGFNTGDIIIVWGRFTPKVGDIIVFNAGQNYPIIHRIISKSPLQTKGDHNSDQLSIEKNIPNGAIVGKAVFRIPYLGWLKLIFVKLLTGFR